MLNEHHDRLITGHPIKGHEESKKNFEEQPLTEEEKEKLGVSKYYRPFDVKHDVKLKSKKGFWIVKRSADIVLSTLALVVLSPIILITMLLIFIEDPHSSPIFKQERIGRGGKTFKCYKLRSMYTGAEQKLKDLLGKNESGDGKAFKMKDDPRITKVGHIIRNTSIDELAQLVNILKGDMSIVGPRPALPREYKLYDEYEKQRFIVTPGLTCFWQTHPRRHELAFDDWVAMDIKYTVERTIALDIKLIAKTIMIVLSGHAD